MKLARFFMEQKNETGKKRWRQLNRKPEFCGSGDGCLLIVNDETAEITICEAQQLRSGRVRWVELSIVPIADSREAMDAASPMLKGIALALGLPKKRPPEERQTFLF